MHVLASAHCQGTFQNLDFASAQIPANTPPRSFVPVTQAFPGWTAALGVDPQTTVLYDAISLGQASASILDSQSTVARVLVGSSYTVVLQAGIYNGLAVNADLTQVGMVPANAKSIQFEEAGSNFAISFTGQNIPMVAIGTGPNYTVFAGDVSRFAGQTGALTLASMPLGPNYPFNGNLFDNITFSSSPIPEPGTGALFLSGALLLGLALRKRLI